MTWTAEQDAIFTAWQTGCPIPSARRDESDFGAPAPFDPPAINPASPASSIWTRFSLRAVPKSGRPFAIGGSAPTYRQGMAIQQIFFPRGFGEAIVSTIVDTCVALFHRLTLTPAAGLQIQFGDAQPPERVAPSPDAAEWLQVNVVHFYELIEH